MWFYPDFTCWCSVISDQGRHGSSGNFLVTFLISPGTFKERDTNMFHASPMSCIQFYFANLEFSMLCTVMFLYSKENKQHLIEKKDFWPNSCIRIREQKHTCILVFKYLVHYSVVVSDHIGQIHSYITKHYEHARWFCFSVPLHLYAGFRTLAP